jgi:hypothetical protein
MFRTKTLFIALIIASVSAHAADPRNHWAFQPVREPAQPTVKNAAWPRTPVDRFIQAKLESLNHKPATVADRAVLLRRLCMDLTGLPPTADEIAAFVADPSPDAYERQVEMLLASPRYGVRWGRHWLDVARYADSKGYVFQEERRFPFSFTYRDYVVQALNADLPYDRFIQEQIAADHLVKGGDPQPLAALGFLTVGRRFLNNVHDIIDDRIDVVSRGLLGLTVSCARCHDHKYDPVPTRDYYSLYGVFASSVEPKDLPLLGTSQQTAATAAFDKELTRLKDKKSQFEKENDKELKANNRKVREQLRSLQKDIDRHLQSHPGSPPRAMALTDLPQPVEPHVFTRGNPGLRGERVPRQFLEVVAGPQRKPFQSGSGRLELAQAITAPNNPLTARVFVNRVWMHHFGAGLVRTPSDFGVRSETPSHPELLDWLAARFVADGWSIKKLHRMILLSATYCQSSNSDSSPPGDPENRLLGRMNRRRLDFEALRDGILFASGRLDESVGGPAVELFKEPFSRRRTLYGFVDRQNLPGTLRAFDFASPDTHCPQRHETTVPQQALFLLNSRFIEQQAVHAVERAIGETDTARIDSLYRSILGRGPDAEETSIAHAFVRNGDSSERSGRWTQLAQVLLLSNEFAFID